MNNLRKYIASITDLSEQGWTVLSECLAEVEFQRNELLLAEGQVCNAIFFISSGYCKAYHESDGKEINTAFYFENDFAANIRSLLTSSIAAYAIKACERIKAVRLDKTKLLEAYRLSHEVEAFGRKVLELTTVKQEEQADSFRLYPPRQRFDQLLLRYPDFLQRVSLTQAASYLGISRETLSRFRAAK